jgi:hypothetical protein
VTHYLKWNQSHVHASLRSNKHGGGCAGGALRALQFVDWPEITRGPIATDFLQTTVIQGTRNLTVPSCSTGRYQAARATLLYTVKHQHDQEQISDKFDATFGKIVKYSRQRYYLSWSPRYSEKLVKQTTTVNRIQGSSLIPFPSRRRVYFLDRALGSSTTACHGQASQLCASELNGSVADPQVKHTRSSRSC